MLKQRHFGVFTGTLFDIESQVTDTGCSHNHNFLEDMLDGKDEQSALRSTEIDKELQEAADLSHRQSNVLVLGDRDVEGRLELLKGMQARYGQPMDEDELRMHATSIRSNIMSTMRLLCKLVQELGLEDQLAAESAPTDTIDSMRTPKECYDLIVESCLLKEREYSAEEEAGNEDWLGGCLHNDLTPDYQAGQFLAMWECIQTLWKVSGYFRYPLPLPLNVRNACLNTQVEHYTVRFDCFGRDN